MRACLKDYNIMYSFFQEIAHRKLEGWEPTPANDPFQAETLKQKQNAMKATYQFICHFFSHPEWFWEYKPYRADKWTNAYEITKTAQRQEGLDAGHIRIRVIADRLYLLYKAWVRDKNPSKRSVVCEKTFFTQIESIGLHKKSKTSINGMGRTVVDLFFQNIHHAVRQIFPQFSLEEWPSEDAGEREAMLTKMEYGSSEIWTMEKREKEMLVV